MASTRSLTLIAAAAALLCSPLVLAQQQQALPAVTISGKAVDNAPVLIGGFGTTPLAKLPMQAESLSAERLKDLGIDSIAGLASVDASVGDSYNAEGYISYLSVRGFTLDNRFNYRRDGLPINAETALPLGNKSALEILKGTSGIQAGTSAPGGLVNLVVKRPQAVDSTVLGLAYSQRGTVEASLDWNHRVSDELALRVNASAARLDPQLRDAQGNRQLLAAAVEWKARPGTLVEAEFELSHQSQPDQAAFSMLGDTVPDPRSVNPRLNLNNQSWTLPTVFDGRTASLRITQQLNEDWRAQAHVGVQRLRTDDHLAFPYGCSAADGTYYADRYCPNGDFDLYDFRSEGERRDSSALDLSLTGKFSAFGLRQELSTGVLFSRFRSRFGGEAYNYMGTGNVDGSVQLPADPSTFDGNTNRDEHGTEFYLRDAVQLGAGWQAWLGLRHTRLQRRSAVTDGSEATRYSQSFTTPWLGLSYAVSPELMAYASWGEGIESDVVPNRPVYANPGQALPAMKSRQFEAGLKAGTRALDWSLAWFDIRQPAWRDRCDGSGDDGSCLTVADGRAHHRGIEATADLKWSGGGLLASAMRLRARNEGSTLDASLNGLTPVNVPQTQVKLHARQDVMSGLQLQGGLVYEGPRAVLPDNSVSIPGWTRLDAGLRYEQRVGSQQWTWRAGIDNLADRRAWRESPYQYSHVYLYPLAPRTVRASLEVRL
ncbi:TonB-dependent siderophore receptor [Pelomonas sp. KK5]|uniref:TonB-dependent siderophore receptor n=1 Tax=Pelomonas sp. KK5 TaxID=1855730 RepID=UPI00097BDC7D|nr:TonB-dependent siderophore receptor [Pelomonas sp. KK5]